MGIRAIGAKTVIRDNDTGDWETLAAQRQQVETDQISLDPFPAQLPEGIEHNMGDCFAPMFQWLKGLVVGEGRQPVSLSSYQLLIHFQGTTGRMGVWYDRPNRRWLFGEDHAREHGFEFTIYSGWLMLAIKQIAKICGLTITAKPQLPCGTSFRSWQRCICLRVSTSRFSQVDGLLFARGAIAIKTVAPLKQLGNFRNSLT